MIVALVAIALFAGFVFLSDRSSINQPTFEGAQLLLPTNRELVTLTKQGEYFAGALTDDSGEVAGFVVLNPKDALQVAEGSSLVPFAVDPDNGDVFVYIGFFVPGEEGIFKDQGSVPLGEGVLFRAVEPEEDGEIAIHFLTRVAGQDTGEGPTTLATVYAVIENATLKETRRVVNGTVE